ncbi:MAG: hypothetical protein HYW10_04410 [Candidatus Omnitrophica bacterium]|nr:hypothetical protein [Candidatus Omnitrophota bacterium]
MPSNFARTSRKTFVFGQQGIALISSYLVLSVLLLYSSGMTMRAATQRLASDKLEDRVKALHLAQGAVEQMREDLYNFFRAQIYQNASQGDAVSALTWLDSLDPNSGGTPNPPLDLDRLYTVSEVRGKGTSKDQARISDLVIGSDAGSIAKTGSGAAWVAKVVSTNPGDSLAPRDIWIRAQATVGSVTKTIEVIYSLNLRSSDIFRYAYFINNFGWFTVGSIVGNHVLINGEFRANGNVRFEGYAASGGIWNIILNGAVYAAANPALGTTGTITGVGGFPLQMNLSTSSATGGWSINTEWNTNYNYWYGKMRGFDPSSSVAAYWNPTPDRARPARQLTFPDQPTIGTGLGGPPRLLLPGWGYDPNRYGPGVRTPDNNFDSFPRKFPGQIVQDMPYLGNLALYKTLASGHNGTSGTGSKLIYRDGATTSTINQFYDGTDPLILDGTTTPIVIDGPVVVTNADVIIKGRVSGRGTIYAGRNIHIVGPVTYVDPPSWVPVERHMEAGPGKGEIRRPSPAPTTILGTVCDSGSTTGPCP